MKHCASKAGSRRLKQVKADPNTNPEFERFNKTMDKLLSVSHEEMQRRIALYKEQAAKNPRKRGPKPKAPKA